jgi:DNA replication protein DnaC
MQSENDQQTSSQVLGKAEMKPLSSAELARLFACNGIPERYWNQRFAKLERPTPEIGKMLDETERHCDTIRDGGRPDKGLFLYGNFGTGKTTCLTAIAKRAVYQCWEQVCSSEPEDGQRASCGNHVFEHFGFYDFGEVMDSVAADMRNGENGKTISDIAGRQWIFIDDMTIRLNESVPESPYRWAYEAVNLLIRRLWNAGDRAGLLYISTNNTLSEISEAFGKPCADRIRGLCDGICAAGTSFRAEP